MTTHRIQMMRRLGIVLIFIFNWFVRSTQRSLWRCLNWMWAIELYWGLFLNIILLRIVMISSIRILDKILFRFTLININICGRFKRSDIVKIIRIGSLLNQAFRNLLFSIIFNSVLIDGLNYIIFSLFGRSKIIFIGQWSFFMRVIGWSCFLFIFIRSITKV